MRGRIDWKYALALELTDSGFDSSVLSEFRTRLINGGGAERLLDELLAIFKEHKLLKERSRQRTDATHVRAALAGPVRDVLERNVGLAALGVVQHGLTVRERRTLRILS